MIRGLKHLICEARVRDLVFFSLETRMVKGQLRAAFQYLKEICKKDKERHLLEPVVTEKGVMVLN